MVRKPVFFPPRPFAYHVSVVSGFGIHILTFCWYSPDPVTQLPLHNQQTFLAQVLHA